MMWAWLVITRITRLVEDVRTGEQADMALDHHDGAPLMVAEALSHALAVWDVWLPVTDKSAGAVLARDGVLVPVVDAPAGAVVQLQDGRLGVVVPAGVIESYGEGLCLILPTAGRYVRAWLVPGVTYLGGV